MSRRAGWLVAAALGAACGTAPPDPAGDADPADVTEDVATDTASGSDAPDAELDGGQDTPEEDIVPDAPPDAGSDAATDVPPDATLPLVAIEAAVLAPPTPAWVTLEVDGDVREEREVIGSVPFTFDTQLHEGTAFVVRVVEAPLGVACAAPEAAGTAAVDAGPVEILCDVTEYTYTAEERGLTEVTRRVFETGDGVIVEFAETDGDGDVRHWRYRMPTDGTPTLRYFDDAGPDGERFTEDDQHFGEPAIALDAHGAVIRDATYGPGEGADGVPYSLDDLVGAHFVRDYDEEGRPTCWAEYRYDANTQFNLYDDAYFVEGAVLTHAAHPYIPTSVTTRVTANSRGVDPVCGEGHYTPHESDPVGEARTEDGRHFEVHEDGRVFESVTERGLPLVREWELASDRMVGPPGDVLVAIHGDFVSPGVRGNGRSIDPGEDGVWLTRDDEFVGTNSSDLYVELEDGGELHLIAGASESLRGADRVWGTGDDGGSTDGECYEPGDDEEWFTDDDPCTERVYARTTAPMHQFPPLRDWR